MKKAILLLVFCGFAMFAQSQGVGINTTGAAPHTSSMLHVDVGTSTTKGVLITGTYNVPSTVPDLGAGTRLMFYTGKAAFLAGKVDGTQWNNANVGYFSTAMGYNTYAPGTYSTAMGYGSTASGLYSTAMGYFTTASGAISTAMGSKLVPMASKADFLLAIPIQIMKAPLFTARLTSLLQGFGTAIT